MMPRAGGQYVYLRESLGPLWGFLYGWTLFLVIQTGTIAAVGVAFGKFLGIFWPAISSSNWIVHIWKVPKFQIGPMILGGMDVGLNTQNLVAILVVVALSVINIFGVKTGAIIQNIFTTAKVSALLGLVLFGVFLGRNAQAIAANFGANFWRNASLGTLHDVGGGVLVSTLTVLAIAQVGSLFSADAWNNVTFTAGEVKNPSRNLPLSLAVGTGVVIALYIACNFIYLTALPLVGSPTGTTFLERGIQFAKEDRTPAVSLMVQMVWTCVLCISGSYGQLLDYIIFAVLVFYVLTIVGLFVLRRTHPEAERPYKAIGYPILPAIYIVMALFIDIVLLRYKPQFTWPGLFIVLLGIPVYYIWRPRAQTTSV